MQILSIEAKPFQVLHYAPSAGPSINQSTLPFHRGLVRGLPGALDAIIATSDLQGFVGDDRATSLAEVVAREILLLQAGAALPPKERTACLLAGDLYPHADAGDVRRVLTTGRACQLHGPSHGLGRWRMPVGRV
jgi:hypothetical protein